VDGLLKEPNILHEAGRGLLHAYTSYARGNIEEVFADGASIIKSVSRTKEDREDSRRTRTSPSDCIQFSGCKNYEISADTTEGVNSVSFALTTGPCHRSYELGLYKGVDATTPPELQFVTCQYKGFVGGQV